jgi:lipopolysaccharide transport system permease protein
MTDSTTNSVNSATEWDLIIQPGKSAKHYWSDLWKYRELFYILSWRDIKVRYKQTVLGAAWSIIRPLLTTIIFTIVFSKIAKLENPGTSPYMLMVFAGMLPWQFFSNALSESSSSLIGNANLITKVYFPRLIIPVSAVITSLLDFFISFIILICMLIWFQFMPHWQIVFLPLFIVLLFFCSMGLGLYLTAINVKYRDFRYIIPFIIQFGLYITPVGFSSSLIGDEWKVLFNLNPMVGIINGFRWCILGEPMNWMSLIFSISIITFFFILGISYFRKMEKSFADHI